MLVRRNRIANPLTVHPVKRTFPHATKVVAVQTPMSARRAEMDAFKIVELGTASLETQGTLFWGLADPGGTHYYWFP
jgi:hypothetical protein